VVGQRLTRRFAALALVAGLGLTGCGSLGNPGVAARVGDEAISISFLQEQVEETLDIAGQNPNDTIRVAELQYGLLRQMIHNRLIVPTGERLGVHITQADVDRVKREIREQQSSPVPSGMLDEYARFHALRRELNVKLLGRQPTSPADQYEADRKLIAEMSKTAREIGIEINPRYGEWEGIDLAPRGGQLVNARGEARQ
jgi:hypothetical protein